MPALSPRAVLFDLDGTLADTAPDLVAAVNQLRTARGLAPAEYSMLRPYASAGARGLIGAAFGLQPGDQDYEALRISFLENYVSAIAAKTRLFDGIPELLELLTVSNTPWGIVTNKAARLTDLLVAKIGLGHAACVVSGDTTPHAKPHPAPLQEAARRIGISPEECWYVGDDIRDIEAGRAAGMKTIAAAWGYCGETAPATWNADWLMETPADLGVHLAQNGKDSKVQA